MRYLPSRAALSDFFEKLEPEILQLLSEAPVLENLAGTFTAPSKLRSVPVEFTDENGAPLIISSRTKATYISQKYLLADYCHLMRIGVRGLSAEEFLLDLKNFLHQSPRNFHKMSKAWHSSFSNALSRIIHDAPQIKSAIMELEIVPTRDGSWISPYQRTICFSDDSYALAIPKGINVYEIHPEVSWSQFRRSLFMNLGAKTFSKDLVCDAIVREHQVMDPKSRSNAELISHVMFLYNANWKNTGMHELYLATEFDTACRGSEIYLNSDEPYSATTLFRGKEKKFHFLHKDYNQPALAIDADFKTWLVRNLKLATYPRLTYHPTPYGSSFSPDFQFLLSTCPSQQILLLLRDNWAHYSDWFKPLTSLSVESPGAVLTEKFSRLRMSCCGGGEDQLSRTVLPLSHMAFEGVTPVSFLDIPEPDDPRWKYLSHFGVVVEPGADQFIQCLRQLKISGASIKQVSELYRQMQGHSVRHGEIIRYLICYIIFSESELMESNAEMPSEPRNSYTSPMQIQKPGWR
jgi:hypothetical protein